MELKGCCELCVNKGTKGEWTGCTDLTCTCHQPSKETYTTGGAGVEIDSDLEWEVPTEASTWTERFDKEFARGKVWSITLCWNEDGSPLIWGSSVEDIKNKLKDFFSKELELQKETALKDIYHYHFEAGKSQALQEVVEFIEKKRESLGYISNTGRVLGQLKEAIVKLMV